MPDTNPEAGCEVFIALPGQSILEFQTVEDAIWYLSAYAKSTRVDYKKYIQSETWRAKAEAAKERAGWRCQVCNASAPQTLENGMQTNGVRLDAHHRTYERLGHELPEDITVLCDACHAKFHGKR